MSKLTGTFLAAVVFVLLAADLSHAKNLGGKKAEVAPPPARMPAADRGKPGEFTGADRSYDVDFEGSKINIRFTSDRLISFVRSGETTVDSYPIDPIKIRDKLFLVHWTEKDGTQIVHVEDFEKMIIYTNISMLDGSFFQVKGTMKEVTKTR